uniref:HMA domain-containing protein n=1 Tax=Leersia perrieri TaxID=77586 RepID=A0A0D9W9F7_9ORYZ
MAKEEELKRVDLKVNVSCCEGCRRKVMKAMSLKGVLRTEIDPSLDMVTIVGDVDSRVLIKKLSKVGKIAEVVAPPPPPPATAKSEEGKKIDGGEKSAAPAGEKNTHKDGKGDKNAAAPAPCKQECSKCTAAAAGKKKESAADEADRAGGKTASTVKDSAVKSGGGGDGDKAATEEVPAVEYEYHQHYSRAEPAMVVPVHVPYGPYYAATPYYAAAGAGGGGYYAMPPPPPQMAAMLHRQLRPQPSRFDEDFFNEDNTVGCHVM